MRTTTIIDLTFSNEFLNFIQFLPSFSRRFSHNFLLIIPMQWIRFCVEGGLLGLQNFVSARVTYIETAIEESHQTHKWWSNGAMESSEEPAVTMNTIIFNAKRNIKQWGFKHLPPSIWIFYGFSMFSWYEVIKAMVDVDCLRRSFAQTFSTFKECIFYFWI